MIRRSRGKKKLCSTSSFSSEIDDGFGSSGDEDYLLSSVENKPLSMYKKKPLRKERHNVSSQDQQRNDLVFDRDLMLARENDDRTQRKGRNDEIINRNDDFILRLISQMRKAAEVNFSYRFF